MKNHERLKALRQKRGEAVASMRAVLDKAAAENRDLTAEENTQYQAWDKEQDSLQATIDREEKQAKIDASITALVDEPVNREPAPNAKPANGRQDPRATPEYRKAFENFLATGASAGLQAALQGDVDSAGGFLAMPVQMVNDLVKSIDDAVFIRGLATVKTVTEAQSLGAPSLDNDPADADWTSELATGNEDSTMSFGRRELHPHPLAKLIKISRKLLRLTAGGAETLVRERLAYKFGVSEEKAFLLGTGASQPLGLFTAHASGVTTARDVATGNTSTAIGADGLIEAKYSVKSGYMQKGVWLFHRDAVKNIRKLKDNNLQYLWRPGLANDEADTILDRPFYMSEYVPNTFTTGKYVGLFGDLSYYWIADALGMELQRLTELYATSNQVGFIGRKETDAMPVLAEAFARVKLA